MFGSGAKQPMTLASGSLGAMPPLSDPLRFVLVTLAGWMNQGQRDVIEYLQEENRALREQLGPRRLRFTDDQRRRLAAKSQDTLNAYAERFVRTIKESCHRESRRPIQEQRRGPGRSWRFTPVHDGACVPTGRTDRINGHYRIRRFDRRAAQK